MKFHSSKITLNRVEDSKHLLIVETDFEKQAFVTNPKRDIAKVKNAKGEYQINLYVDKVDGILPSGIVKHEVLIDLELEDNDIILVSVFDGKEEKGRGKTIIKPTHSDEDVKPGEGDIEIESRYVD